MRPIAYEILLATLIALVPSLARAQSPRVNALFTSTYDGSSVHLGLSIDDSYAEAGHLVNVDVVRVDVGTCGNETPIARLSWSPQRTIVADLVDPNIAPDRGYQYQIWGVNAAGDRVEITGVWDFPIKSWVVTGHALIAHGVVDLDADGYGLAISTCEQECYPWGQLTHGAPGVGIVPGNTVVLGWGSVGDVHPQFGASILLTSAREGACVVAVESLDWSGAKRLFR